MLHWEENYAHSIKSSWVTIWDQLALLLWAKLSVGTYSIFLKANQIKLNRKTKTTNLNTLNCYIIHAHIQNAIQMVWTGLIDQFVTCGAFTECLSVKVFGLTLCALLSICIIANSLAHADVLQRKKRKWADTFVIQFLPVGIKVEMNFPAWSLFAFRAFHGKCRSSPQQGCQHVWNVSPWQLHLPSHEV